MATVHLKAGHVRPIWAGHPWVFQQGVEEVKGAPGAGDVVTVVDPKGKFLGRGFWSPKSAIPVRILTRNQDDNLGVGDLAKRIEAAAGWRKALWHLPGPENSGYRLVHAEGDRLAGLIVDVYGDVAAVQFLTIGMKRREEELFAHIARVAGAKTVIEIPSKKHQSIEGFESELRVVRGPDVDKLNFVDRGLEYEVPLGVLQKTGFYFDQRDNRARLESLAKGKRVLDAFCYVGGFAMAAARGGASEVLAIDKSAGAIAAASAISSRNGFADRITFNVADLKKALSDLHRKNERFDMVIVDPPKLAPTARHLDKGKKAYRRLNANALKLVKPGGMLISCSCSAALKPSGLMRILGVAAADAGRDVTLLSMGEQSPDHPIPAAFPEGRYLKCAFVQVQ